MAELFPILENIGNKMREREILLSLYCQKTMIRVM
jgi:hypothetical protein